MLSRNFSLKTIRRRLGGDKGLEGGGKVTKGQRLKANLISGLFDSLDWKSGIKVKNQIVRIPIRREL